MHVDVGARQTLERAASLDGDDPFAHLYLGIALLKTGARERGRNEIDDGLRAIDDALEYIAEDRIDEFFWDPGMEIRNDIRRSLATKLDDAQLAIAVERIGRLFDEEIDKARRYSRRGGGGGRAAAIDRPGTVRHAVRLIRKLLSAQHTLLLTKRT